MGAKHEHKNCAKYCFVNYSDVTMDQDWIIGTLFKEVIFVWFKHQKYDCNKDKYKSNLANGDITQAQGLSLTLSDSLKDKILLIKWNIQKKLRVSILKRLFFFNIS